jgi:hypothetical protein
MMFLELTNVSSGEKILVNMATVSQIRPLLGEPGSMLIYTIPDDHEKVKESRAAIMKMMGACNSYGGSCE